MQISTSRTRFEQIRPLTSCFASSIFPDLLCCHAHFAYLPYYQASDMSKQKVKYVKHFWCVLVNALRWPMNGWLLEKCLFLVTIILLIKRLFTFVKVCSLLWQIWISVWFILLCLWYLIWMNRVAILWDAIWLHRPLKNQINELQQKQISLSLNKKLNTELRYRLLRW